MRILLQNSVFSPNMIGGSEHSTLLLARTLSELGHRVDVLCTTGRRGKEEPHTRKLEGIEGTVYEGPSAGLLDLYARETERASVLRKGLHHWNSVRSVRWERWLQTHFAAHSYDVLHSNNLAGMGDAPWREAGIAGVPVVHTLRDYALLCPRTTLWRSRGENCERAPIPCRLLRRQKSAHVDDVSLWVAASAFVLETHARLGTLGKAQRRVIANAYTGEWPAEFTAPASDPFRVLYMGQLEEHKGLRLLFRALEKLWRCGRRIECTIAGSGSLAAETEIFAHAHAEHCRYLGRIAGEAKEQALRAASLVAYASIWREPFGLGVIEGFAHGRPVLACRGSGGPEELICDGSDGRVVEPTGEALALAMRDYMDAPDSLLAHAQAAWKRRDEFGAGKMANEYLNAYERALAC